MKKCIILSYLLFSCIYLFSQNYLITFGGTGSSTTVDSVFVENLTQGTKLAMKGSDVLNLTSTTGINAPDLESEAAGAYPNPMDGHAKLLFTVKETGNVVVSIYDLSGKLVIQSNKFLQSGRHKYLISGLNSGIYAINISGQHLNHSIKLVSENHLNGKAIINYASVVNNGNEIHLNGTQLKSSLSTIPMQYNGGERLKFTGKSGIYGTVLTDIPFNSKYLTFNFAPCTDADNNNYSIVQIGTQTWMAENLKTTKYRDGAAIPNVTDNTAWATLTTGAYCWYNNDATTYKSTYGALYNWYAVNTGKLCPTGWHVPGDTEWTILENYLITNGYNYDGSTTDNKITKSLAATTNWISYSGTGTVGNADYPAYRNKTGFTALPGGWRNSSGTFGYVGYYGNWWSSTDYNYLANAWYRSVLNNYSNVYRNTTSKSNGFSVRCLRD